MHALILYLALGMCVVVGFQDLRTRRIPNALSLAMAVLGLVRIALAQDAVAGSCTLAAGAMVFSVTLTLFLYGVIGGGDAKLIPAIVLVIGYGDLLGFLFLMSLWGGVLAVATMVVDKSAALLRRFRGWVFFPLPPGSDRLQLPARVSTVPYGIAIAAAGVMTLMASR